MSNTAKDAQALAKAYQVVAHSLSISIAAATKLLDSLMKNKDTQQFAEMILKIGSDPNHTDKDFIVTQSLHADVIPTLSEILKRESTLAANIISADPNDKNTGNVIVYFDCQKNKVNLALSEALARSGLMSEIDRTISDEYMDKLKDNPMSEIKGMSIEKYEMLRQDIAKLKYPLNKVTLFPKYYEQDGVSKVDVGFLSNTTEKTIRTVRGKLETVGPYSIPNIVKGLMIKQQMLENSKEGLGYENFIRSKLDYQSKLNDYVNFSSIQNDRAVVLNINERLRRLNIDDKDKNILLKLLNDSKLSQEGRYKFLEKLNDIESDSISKEVIAKKVEELQDVRYFVPATIHYDRGEPVYTLERDYAVAGAIVETSVNSKVGISDIDKSDREIEFFVKTSMDADNRTVLVLSEDEFKKYRNHKEVRKEELEFTKGGSETMNRELKAINQQKGSSEKTIEVFNSNQNYFEVSTEGMDMFDVVAEQNTPSLVNELLYDHKDIILGENGDQEFIKSAIEDVEDNYEIHEVETAMTVDTLIEDVIHDEIFPDHGRDYVESHQQGFEEIDYDRDRDGQDDRDQFN